MKRLIAILGIFLLILTACAPAQKTVTMGAKDGTEPLIEQTTPEAKILEDLKTATEAANDRTKGVVVPINIKEGKPGDFVAIGVMFNLVNRQPGGYFARITYIEGRDNNGNKIEVNPDTMKTWLVQSQTQDYTIPESGSQFVPVQFRIGSEIKPGVKTQPGAYQYEIQFFERIESEFDEKIEAAVKQVFVKVK